MQTTHIEFESKGRNNQGAAVYEVSCNLHGIGYFLIYSNGAYGINGKGLERAPKKLQDEIARLIRQYPNGLDGMMVNF